MKPLPQRAVLPLLALTLALGFFAGAMADRFYINRNFHRFARSHFIREIDRRGPEMFLNPGVKGRPPGNVREDHEMFKEKALRQLTARLRLTDAQQRSIGEVMDFHRQSVDARKELFFRELRFIVDRTSAEIEHLLSEDQRVEFAKLMERGRSVHSAPPPP
jgi:hypothetical protein